MAKPPLCRMCKLNEMILIGSLNGVEIRYCGLCDRESKKT